MPLNGTSVIAIWAAQGAMALIVGVVSWNVTREFDRNDDQEIRLRATEQAVVEIQFMRADISEMKTALNRLADRP